MLHILMKVSEILYLSVCQIPTPIRSFIKIFADSLIMKDPTLSKEDLYRILNELVVDKWLSVSFQQPEFFGILPKPLHFSEKYKNTFFLTAQKVGIINYINIGTSTNVQNGAIGCIAKP